MGQYCRGTAAREAAKHEDGQANLVLKRRQWPITAHGRGGHLHPFPGAASDTINRPSSSHLLLSPCPAERGGRGRKKRRERKKISMTFCMRGMLSCSCVLTDLSLTHFPGSLLRPISSIRPLNDREYLDTSLSTTWEPDFLCPTRKMIWISAQDQRPQ